MKRRLAFNLPLVGAVTAALGLTACEKQPEWNAGDNASTRVCVDKEGRRIAETNCTTHHVNSGLAGFWYYYAASRAFSPRYGEHVTGGSFQARQGVSYASPEERAATRAASARRGGFGGSARAFGGGGFRGGIGG